MWVCLGERAGKGREGGLGGGTWRGVADGDYKKAEGPAREGGKIEGS